MKLLLYCTKAKPYITISNDKQRVYPSCVISDGIKEWHFNGKIVAECDFEVEEIFIKYGEGWQTDNIKGTENIEKLSCINREQLYQYCKGKGYAIHIKNLHIFDEPKELSDYSRRLPNGDFQVLGNAPQNMMKCCEIKYIIEDYILISIRPEWLCKILNGEKTIEVRKSVLKEMLK